MVSKEKMYTIEIYHEIEAVLALLKSHMNLKSNDYLFYMSSFLYFYGNEQIDCNNAMPSSSINIFQLYIFMHELKRKKMLDLMMSRRRSSRSWQRVRESKFNKLQEIGRIKQYNRLNIEKIFYKLQFLKLKMNYMMTEFKRTTVFQVIVDANNYKAILKNLAFEIANITQTNQTMMHNIQASRYLNDNVNMYLNNSTKYNTIKYIIRNISYYETVLNINNKYMLNFSKSLSIDEAKLLLAQHDMLVPQSAFNIMDELNNAKKLRIKASNRALRLIKIAYYINENIEDYIYFLKQYLYMQNTYLENNPNYFSLVMMPANVLIAFINEIENNAHLSDRQIHNLTIYYKIMVLLLINPFIKYINLSSS